MNVVNDKAAFMSGYFFLNSGCERINSTYFFIVYVNYACNLRAKTNFVRAPVVQIDVVDWVLFELDPLDCHLQVKAEGVN